MKSIKTTSNATTKSSHLGIGHFVHYLRSQIWVASLDVASKVPDWELSFFFEYFCMAIGQNFDDNICASCTPYFASSAVDRCTCYNYLDPGKLPQWCSRSPQPPPPVLGQFGGHLRLLVESSLSFDNIYPVGISSTIFLGGSTRCILRPVALLNGRVVIETSRAAHCVSLGKTHQNIRWKCID